MQTVYISNSGPDHVYDTASRFGCLSIVTSGNYPIFKTARLCEEIVRALAYSQPDDYLILSGSSVIAGLCVGVWLTMHSKVNLLLYDKKTKEYELRTIKRASLLLSVEQQRDRIDEKK